MSINLISFVLFTLFFKVTLLQITISISANETTTVVEQVINDDETHTWNSSNYPEAYRPNNQSVLVNVDDGYSVLVIVEDVDLDSNNGDFLIINSGIPLNNNNNQGKIFAYNLKRPRKYLLHSKNLYFSFRVLGNNTVGKRGFLIKYRRVGEEATTITENPTTAVTWPTASSPNSTYYTTYVGGKTQKDFENDETVTNLKMAIAEMATQYSDVNGILLRDNITVNNVQINLLIRCSFTWPNGDSCVKIQFAVPVLLHENSTVTGYQLATEHLEIMWTNFAKLYLEKHNFYVYEQPDNESSSTIWIVTFCITLILFLLLLYCVKLFGRNLIPLNSIKKLGETRSMVQKESRISKLSLGPHPLQVTPPFFDNDYSFDQFEPDISIRKRNSTSSLGNGYPFSEDDSDVEIVYNNFRNSRNDIENDIKESHT